MANNSAAHYAKPIPCEESMDISERKLVSEMTPQERNKRASAFSHLPDNED